MKSHPRAWSAALAAALLLSACGADTTTGAPSGTAAPPPSQSGSGPDGAASSAPPATEPDPAASGSEPPSVTEAVVTAADAFLGGLSPEQRERVLYDSTDPALREWAYFPTTDDRNGIALAELTDAQRAAALGVADAVLSDAGSAQLRGVLAAEDALGVRNGESGVTSGRYFIAFFGQPTTAGRFTVQVNGHHYALNTTYEGERVSPTPAFTGVDPVEVDIDGQRVRPMLAETDAVTGLLGSLDEGALAAARIGPVDDVRVGTGASDQYPAPEGVLVSDLDPQQQERVTAAVRAWVGDTDERVAELLVAQYAGEFDRTRVAWSGSTDPDTPGSYLRIDGPRLWIEFSNVGRFANGDEHYHSVYRDELADYLG